MNRRTFLCCLGGALLAGLNGVAEAASGGPRRMDEDDMAPGSRGNAYGHEKNTPPGNAYGRSKNTPNTRHDRQNRQEHRDRRDSRDRRDRDRDNRRDRYDHRDRDGHRTGTGHRDRMDGQGTQRGPRDGSGPGSGPRDGSGPNHQDGQPSRWETP